MIKGYFLIFWMIAIQLSLGWAQNKTPEKRFLKTQELMGDRSYEEASQALKKLLVDYAEHPGRDRWLLELIRTYQYLDHQKLFLAAVEEFEDEFPHSLFSPKVRFLLAAHEWKIGRKEACLKIYTDHLTTLLSSSYQEWLAKYDYYQGVQAFREKSYHKAVAHFSQVLELVPEYPTSDFYYYFATSLFYQAPKQRERENQYNQQVENIIERELNHPLHKKASFHYLKGKMLLRKKAWEQARKEFIKFLELREINPEDADHPALAYGWIEMGNSFLEQRQLKEALNCYQKAIDLSPELEKEITINMVEAAYIKEQYELVIELVNQYFKHADSATVIRYLGIAYQKLGRIEEAERVFGEFLGKFPNHHLWQDVRDRIPTMIYERIQKLLAQFRYQEAKQWIQESAERFPNDRRAAGLLFREGVRLEEVGYFAEAKEIYGLILAKFPSSPLAPRALIHLGYLAFEKNLDENEYRGYFDNLFTLFADSPSARQAKEFLETQNQKFLSITAPTVSHPQHPAILQIQSKQVSKLKFKAYPINIPQYLEVKKSFKELETITVDVVLPQQELMWEVELPKNATTTQIQVPFSHPGVYIIRAFDDEISAVTILNVSKINIFSRQLGNQFFLFAQDYASNLPLDGAKVTLYVDQSPFLQTRTQKDGVLFVDLPEKSNQVSLLVEYDSHLFFREFEIVPVQDSKAERAIFAFTDQREYYPGNSVQIYGWTRPIDKDQIIFKDQKEALHIRLYNTKGQLLALAQPEQTESGFFYASFPLEHGVASGRYKVQIKQGSDQKDLVFNLRPYPLFDFEIEIPKRIVTRGQKIELKVSSKEANNSNPIQISYQVYLGTNHDEKPLTLWESANFLLASEKSSLYLKTQEVARDSQLYLIMTAKQGEKQIRSEHRFWVKTQEKYLKVAPKQNWSYVGEKQEIQIYLTDAFENPLSEEGSFQIVQATTEKIFAQEKWTTSEEGKASLSIQLEQAGLYRIEISKPGNALPKQQVIWRVKPAPLEKLEIQIPERDEFSIRSPIPIKLKAPLDKITAILTIEQGKVLSYQVLHLTQDSLSFDLPLKPSYIPEIKIRIALSWKEQWLEDEVICRISQKIIFGWMLDKEQGAPTQENSLIVQVVPDSHNPRFFPIFIPQSNVPSSLSQKKFLQEFYQKFKFSTFLDESEQENSKTESEISFKEEDSELILDKNLLLKGHAKRLNGTWQKSAPNQFKLPFKNPKIPGKYLLYLFAFDEEDRSDLEIQALKIVVEDKSLIDGPQELYVGDKAEYFLAGQNQWSCSDKNATLEKKKNSIIFAPTQTGTFLLTAKNIETKEELSSSIEIKSPDSPSYKVYYQPQSPLILPSDIDWSASILELKLWQGLSQEAEQSLNKLKNYSGKELYLIAAQLLGELLHCQLEKKKVTPVKSLSKLYTLQNRDGSFSKGNLTRRIQDTCLALYLFSKLREQNISFDLEVCRKAINFLEPQRREDPASRQRRLSQGKQQKKLFSGYQDFLIEYILELHSNILSLPHYELPLPKEQLGIEKLALLRLIALQRFDHKTANKALERLKSGFLQWRNQNSPIKLWQNAYSSYIFVFEAFGDFVTTKKQRKELFYWFLTKQTEWGFGSPFADLHLFYSLVDFKIAYPPQQAELILASNWQNSVQGNLAIPLTEIYNEKVPHSIAFSFKNAFPPSFRFVLKTIPKKSKNYRRYISSQLYHDPWTQKLLGEKWYLGGPEIHEGKPGDRWFVHLHLHLEKQQNSLTLEDYLPAGATFGDGGMIIGPHQSYFVRPHKIFFHLNSLPPGDYDFIYPIVWLHSGDYQVPSPRLVGMEFSGFLSPPLKIYPKAQTKIYTVGKMYQQVFSEEGKSNEEKVKLLVKILNYPLIDLWKKQVLREKMRLMLHFLNIQEAHQMTKLFSDEELSIQDHLDLARSYLQSPETLMESHHHLIAGLLRCCQKEIRLVNIMQQASAVQRSQDYFLNHVIFNYPDFDSIAQEYLNIATQQMQQNEEGVILSFLATYPEHPLAESATLDLIQFYKTTGQFEKAISKIRTFLSLFPKNANYSKIHYELGFLLYETAQYDEALMEMRKFISETIETPRLRAQGRLLLGKIYQVKGKYREAVDQFRYSKLTDASILLEELRSSNLSVPKLAKISLNQRYEFPIEFRNLKEVNLAIYPIDLISLFERNFGLSQIEKIDLTGLVPMKSLNVELNALPYDSAEHKHRFPPLSPGAYLIYVYNGKLSDYSILLVSDLKASLTRFGSHLRLSVRKKSAEPIRRAQIRILSGERILRGTTNIRGIWDIKGKQRPEEILVAYQGEYDFIKVKDEN